MSTFSVAKTEVCGNCGIIYGDHRHDYIPGDFDLVGVDLATDIPENDHKAVGVVRCRKCGTEQRTVIVRHPHPEGGRYGH